MPIVCPSDDMVRNSLAVIRDWYLHYYQLLYCKKLTYPEKLQGRFYTELDKDRNFIKVGCNANAEYDFYISIGMKDEDVLRRCELILQSIAEGRKKKENRYCCPLAKGRNCVCYLSFDCVLHGQTCIGTHD